MRRSTHRGLTRSAAWIASLALLAGACATTTASSGQRSGAASSDPIAAPSSEPAVAAPAAATSNAVSTSAATAVPVLTAVPSATVEPPATAVPLSTAVPTPVEPAVAPPAQVPFRTGAEALADRGFDLLAGQRVGLIANQTSLVDGQHLLDLLVADPDVDLVAAFAPEHGIRGDLDAGEIVPDGVDGATAVPVFSLYGGTRQPTAEMLADIDVLVYDLQDVGARFYTYISTMGLALQAAAWADIPMIVLDRPNPQQQTASAGFVRTPGYASFVGQYAVPSSYGLTVGELAQMIVGDQLLDGLEGVDVRVVRMQGWQRSDGWPDEPAGWVPPSPGLPTLTSAQAYPGTVLFEATPLSVGRGTADTFAFVGAPWVDAVGLASSLNDQGLSGVTFEPATFVPTVTAQAAAPRFLGQAVSGVRYRITAAAEFEPVSTGIHVFVALRDAAGAAGQPSLIDRPDMFDLLAGSGELRTLIESGTSAEAIVAAWQPGAAEFDARKQRYQLYD